MTSGAKAAVRFGKQDFESPPTMFIAVLPARG
jgi:hypothetical protein